MAILKFNMSWAAEGAGEYIKALDLCSNAI